MSYTKDISVELKGLLPYEKYNYTFNSIFGNCPIVVAPNSGSLIAASPSGKIDATVYFCSSASECSGCTGYLMANSCFCNNISDQDKFHKIQLSFYSTSDPDYVYKSDAVKVTYSGSKPVVKLNVPNTILATGLNKDVEQKITINFDNLIPNTSYAYTVETLDSDWPFSVSSNSGLFYANSNSGSIDIYGGFCASTGSCLNGQWSILPYSIKNSSGINNWYKADVSFRLSVVDQSCPTTIVYSNVLNIRCLDCVNNLKFTNGVGITFSETSTC